MAQPTSQRFSTEGGWTEADLADLPADGNRYEIIDGSLHVTPPADGPIAHLYDRAAEGHYELHRSVGPDETVKVDEPFPVEVSPGTWTA